MKATKKQQLAEIREELERNGGHQCWVKNIGKVFFSMYGGACVLRDVVYYSSLRHGVDFEVLSLDSHYFVGSKEHAKALQEAFGGEVERSEFFAYAENPRDLYIWKKGGKYPTEPLDYEEAVEAIFS